MLTLHTYLNDDVSVLRSQEQECNLCLRQRSHYGNSYLLSLRMAK
jgi:hypothetical protein